MLAPETVQTPESDLVTEMLPVPLVIGPLTRLALLVPPKVMVTVAAAVRDPIVRLAEVGLKVVVPALDPLIKGRRRT